MKRNTKSQPTNTTRTRPGFLSKFDEAYRCVKSRLHRFDTADRCGRWNSTLIKDFQADQVFARAADELFAAAVADHTAGSVTVSDGVAMEGVTIDFRRSIRVHFRLHFLDSAIRCRAAPGQFSIAKDRTRDRGETATLSCGLRFPDGDFWYSPKTRDSSVVFPDGHAWAYQHERVYHQPKISSWIETHAKRNKRP